MMILMTYCDPFLTGSIGSFFYLGVCSQWQSYKSVFKQP